MYDRVVTGRNEVVAKVIFLHLSVILFTGRGHAWQRWVCMARGVFMAKGEGGMCGKEAFHKTDISSRIIIIPSESLLILIVVELPDYSWLLLNRFPQDCLIVLNYSLIV